MSEQAFFPQSKTITIYDQEVNKPISFEVREFTFQNRLEFVKIIAKIFTNLAKNRPEVKFANSDSEVIAFLLETAGREILEIYVLVSGLSKEFLEKNLTLKKEVEILSAIFEVNDLPLVLSQIQKQLSRASQ